MNGRRTDGRLHDTGLIRPYRPAPKDFRDIYLRLGWDGIEEHYGTNSRCIARWIEECGGEELRQARAAVSGHPVKPGNRRKPYAAGGKLTGVKSRRAKGERLPSCPAR
jgi:hypothetical protein